MQETGEKQLESMISQSPLPVNRIAFASAETFESELETMAREEQPLLVGGGDGTINMAVQALDGTGKEFGILPLGTMNLMARDLGISPDLADALEQYASAAKPRSVDAAYLNGRLFLCSATVGAIPQASVWREKNRDTPFISQLPDLVVKVMEQMDPEQQQKYELTIDGRELPRRGYATIVISNNLYDEDGDLLDHGLSKAGLRGGTLGVYTLQPKHFFDKMRLLLLFQAGFWKSDPIVHEYRGHEVTLNSSSSEILTSLDGEPMTLEPPLHFSIKPGHICFLAPE